MVRGLESSPDAVMQVYDNWVAALDACSDLADGVRQCRALLPPGYDSAMAQMQHQVYEVLVAGVDWLAARFPAIWAGVPKGIGPPIPWWQVDVQIWSAIETGTFASREMRDEMEITSVLCREAVVDQMVGIAVYDVAGPSKERALLWSNTGPSEEFDGRFRALTLQNRCPLIKVFADYGSEVEHITTALVQAWPEIRPYIGPPGRRRQGTTPDYGRAVRLYELWRANPTNTPKRPDLRGDQQTITWAKFAERVRDSGQISGWDENTSDRTIEKSTKDAIANFAPDPAVPATLEAYLAARTH